MNVEIASKLKRKSANMRKKMISEPKGKAGGTKKKTIKRKRNKKVSKNDNTPVIVEDESSIIMENPIEASTMSISNGEASTAAEPNYRSSLTSKIGNGFATLPSLINGTTENNLSIVTKNTNALFHSLCYSEDVLSALPNRNWAIHSTEVPEKRVVVSSMILYNSEGIGLTPVYIKQIIFDEKLNFDILLVNSKIVLKDKPNMIRTMHDFEDLLDYVDGLKVCRGGPSISKYNNVNPECAYRDSMNNWRHNLCTLEISLGDVCDSCHSLDEILRRHSQRVRTPLKSRSFSRKKLSQGK